MNSTDEEKRAELLSKIDPYVKEHGVVCKDCMQRMKDAKGCLRPNIKILLRGHTKEKIYDRIINGDETRFDDSDAPSQFLATAEAWKAEKWDCHDCGATYGFLHHWGCDMEECPECRLQMISCDCTKITVKDRDMK